MKKPRELERNSERRERDLYWRERPIHSLAKFPGLIRRLATDSKLTHWGLQIGDDYIIELEANKGKVGHHVGIWIVPQKEGSPPFIGTQRDGDPSNSKSSRGQLIGHTCMTDLEIQARSEK